MGGVDLNDQLLRYSPFSRCAARWWKKMFFRMMNICMLNSYICYKEWCNMQGISLNNKTQNGYRVAIIKQIVNEVGGSLKPKRRSCNPEALQRLHACHLPSKIQSAKKTTTRSCKVCVPAEHTNAGVKRKRPGRETSYECKSCNVAL